jgi:hypothetical protein
LVAEDEEALRVLIIAVVNYVLNETGDVSGTFVRLESDLAVVDQMVHCCAQFECHSARQDFVDCTEDCDGPVVVDVILWSFPLVDEGDQAGSHVKRHSSTGKHFLV